MIVLDKFSSFLQKEEKSSSTINGYVGFAKKYLRQCGGIRISGEDMADYVTIPANTEEGELEPFTKRELRLLIENCSKTRRKAFYMVMKDTECRTRERIQLKKKYFDLDNNTVLFPKKIVKGKKRRRIQRK